MMRGHGVPLPRTPQHVLKAEGGSRGEADLGSVLTKLVIFSIAMVIAPIGTYYLSRDYLFDSNPTYSAIAAVVVANAILVMFIYIAFKEDQEDYREEQEKKKKEAAKGGKTQ
ncbi:hypothetical protein JCM10207_001055 [Rhodosporidiobolus poonsookiae]